VDKHKGTRAWIIGNGPSLNKIDMTLLRDEVTFGSNRLYLGFSDWNFATQYWSVLDSLQCEQSMREWEMNIPDETVKLLPFEYMNLFQIQNMCPVNFYPAGHPECKTNFMDPLNAKELAKSFNFSNKPDVVYLGHNVLYALLQAAVIMGCDPIYLVGVDHNYKISKKDQKRGLWSDGGSSNHFHEGYGKSGGNAHEFQLPEIKEIERAFDKAAEWALANDVTIKNATPGTKLRSFPKISFTSALELGESAQMPVIKPKPPKTSTPLAPYVRPQKPTATILICTPGVGTELTQQCLDSLRDHTGGVSHEVLLFENGQFGSFQHAHKLNRALEVAQGDVFVTLDDDVILTSGWLEAMIEEAKPDVGVVSCVNQNGKKELFNNSPIRSVSTWFDLDGNCHHITDHITEPLTVPSSCSSCWLINDRELRFDLRYLKFYHEVDFCYSSWERGKKVILSPHAVYTWVRGKWSFSGWARRKSRTKLALTRKVL
jgi:hypothetical protein